MKRPLPFLLLLHFAAGVSVTAQLELTVPQAKLPLFLVLLAVWFLVYYAVCLQYSVVYYIYMDDPFRPLTEILREGFSRMRGQHLRRLRLSVSFIGYLPLVLFSFGLGLLWVLPYIGTAGAGFYLSLPEQQEKAPEETDAPGF